MKKLFTLATLALVLGAGQADAQNLRKTWDFREGFSAKTINALKGDQEEFGDSKYWRNYEGDATKADEQHFWNASESFKNADNVACTHNGGSEKPIAELEGLHFTSSTKAKKVVITYDGATSPNEFESEGGPALGEPIPHGKSYLWINGKNEKIQFQAEVNQTIKIGVESHAVNRKELGQARGIKLSASTGTLTLTQGNAVPTYYTECEWTLEGEPGEVATLTMESTNGCHIYYIIVGEGDDPNANKTKVGYVTAGDATAEAAYQAIAADETYAVTAIDAATATAEQLQGYPVTVVSPELPADNAVVETLRQAMNFTPIVNLNGQLYATWNYGEPAETDMTMALVTDIKNGLFAGLVQDEDYTAHEVEGQYVIDLGSEFTGVRLGDFFAGDATPAVDGNDESITVAHLHNTYHNAYIYLPFGTSPAAQKMLFNAIDMAKDSKSEIEKAPAPKINIEYKNLNTNITLSMASSALPKPQIFYTLDGTEPTAESTLYTDVINVTSETTVKAVALAEGYLLSDVAEAKAEIFSQPATPVIAKDYQDGKTVVTLTCETENVDLWYNFTEGNDTTKSMKYTEPITIALPTDLNAFAVAGGQVFSEIASERIVVKNVVVRQDQIGLFDANAAEYQNGGGSTVYYFSWGKNARSIYDTTAEPIDVIVNDSTGDEKPVYPEVDYEYYLPSDTALWEVKSKGQVMIWQSLSIGKDPGNDSGYNPETAGDLLSYATPSNNDVQFAGKTSGEPCTGAIQSRVKWAGPFDVVTIVGTASGGDNVGRMQLQVSKDSVNWENLGDEMATSTVKRLWKSYTRSYNETDEVYVRIVQAGGGAGVQIYNMFILNEGEKSQALKEQYNQEFNEVVGDGILTVNSANSAMKGIYNLNGIRREAMQQGLNIVVSEDGQVRKVLVK